MNSTKRLLIAAGAVAVVVAVVATVTGASELGLSPDTLVKSDSQTTVEGTVSGIEGTVLRLLGGNVAIDIASARIVGDGSLPPATEGAAVHISVGDRVSAQVDLPSETGRPLIGRFLTVSHPRDGSLSGVVQHVDLGARTLTVANQLVGVNDQTTYGGATARGRLTKLEDLSAGDKVFLALSLPGGRLVAVRVEAFAPPVPLVTFTGPVESIGSTSWTIGGRIVLVTGETKIADGPQVGDQVQVVGKVNELGVLVALSIVRVSPRPTSPPPTTRTPEPPKSPTPTRTPDPNGTRIEFKGIVEAIPEGRIGTWVVSGRKVEVSPATVISGEPRLRDTVVVNGYVGFVSIAATKIAKVDVVIATPR